MMNLFYSGRKLCLASSVHDMYLRAETQCRSCRIHGYVSAAHDCYFFAACDRCIIRFVKGFHQIASGQVLIGGKYAVGIFSRNAHKHRKTCAGADKNGLKAFFLNKLIDGGRLSDDHIGLKLHAQLFHLFDLFCNHLLLRKTELRNPVYKHSAQLVKSLKHSHLVSHLCQVSRTGQTGRAGTDDSNLMSVGAFRSFRFDVMFQSIIRNEPLQLADGYRFALDPADTFSLTLGFLWTYASADCRQGGSSSDHLICLFNIAFLDFLNKSRNIDGYRTSADALCILAVDAAGSFFHGFLLVISQTNLFKICSAYFWFLFSDRHFL